MKLYYTLIFTFILSIYNFGQEANLDLKNKELAQLKSIKDKNRNYDDKIERNAYDSHFSSIEHQIKRGFEKDKIITDIEYTNFIKNIFNKLGDTTLNKDISTSRFYIFKSNLPNATSLGYNIYFIESGLFSQLDNQYQIAAVICHELAHNELNHTKASLKQEAEFIKDFKKEFKTLRRQDLIKLIKSQDEVIRKKYDLAEQSRNNEISADSLGFVYYKKLNYPVNEYFLLLKKIEKLDETNKYILQDSIYSYLFDIPNNKFNPQSIKLEKNSLFEGLNYKEYINKDSIRTHPNLTDRLDWIQKNTKEKFNENVENPSTEFTTVKAKEVHNYYENYLENEEYVDALIELFYEKQMHTNRTDIDEYIGKIFTLLYESRKSLKFNKYVPQADANNEDQNRQKLLHFLWTLSNDDLKNIGDFYTKKATN